MKCSVIRDLLPSYIDGLSSVESDKIIEEHLSKCEECKEYYMQMQKGIEAETCKEQEGLNPFVKIKRDTIRKMILAVVITVCVVTVAWEQYIVHYTYGESMYEDEIDVSLEENNGIATLRFEPKEEGVIVDVGYPADVEIFLNGKAPLKILNLSKSNYHEKYSRGRGHNQYQLYFIDDNTALDLFSNVNEFQYEEDDYFAVLYNEGYQIVYMKDLKEGNADGIQFVEDSSIW